MNNECGARPCKPAGHKRTPWWDESITPEIPQEQLDRELDARRVRVAAHLTADDIAEVEALVAAIPSPTEVILDAATAKLGPPRHWHAEIWDSIATVKRVFENQTEINDASSTALRAQIGINAQLRAALAEQSALITEQRAAIEELRGWIQECSDGVSNLGMRVAKLEDAVPSVGKPTMQEQESEAFYAGARQMSEALAEEDPSE